MLALLGSKICTSRVTFLGDMVIPPLKRNHSTGYINSDHWGWWPLEIMGVRHRTCERSTQSLAPSTGGGVKTQLRACITWVVCTHEKRYQMYKKIGWTYVPTSNSESRIVILSLASQSFCQSQVVLISLVGWYFRNRTHGKNGSNFWHIYRFIQVAPMAYWLKILPNISHRSLLVRKDWSAWDSWAIEDLAWLNLGNSLTPDTVCSPETSLCFRRRSVHMLPFSWDVESHILNYLGKT